MDTPVSAGSIRVIGFRRLPKKLGGRVPGPSLSRQSGLGSPRSAPQAPSRPAQPKLLAGPTSRGRAAATAAPAGGRLGGGPLRFLGGALPLRLAAPLAAQAHRPGMIRVRRRVARTARIPVTRIHPRRPAACAGYQRAALGEMPPTATSESVGVTWIGACMRRDVRKIVTVNCILARQSRLRGRRYM